mmetsp:Transcript_38229/g.114403  ORF Transcript_38229/g.114403 Transcript_38229/m.114403 type:complete len:269 (+) Transcript_38229:510-1316(+)
MNERFFLPMAAAQTFRRLPRRRRWSWGWIGPARPSFARGPTSMNCCGGRRRRRRRRRRVRRPRIYRTRVALRRTQRSRESSSGAGISSRDSSYWAMNASDMTKAINRDEGGGCAYAHTSAGRGGQDEGSSAAAAADDDALPAQEDLCYDLVFDYTFFCALPPSMRPRWGRRMSELLCRDTGRLLTLMFPLPTDADADADADDGVPPPSAGPPYPVTVQDYRNTLEPYGFEMIEPPGPYENDRTVKPRRGRELVCWWKLREGAGMSSKL